MKAEVLLRCAEKAYPLSTWRLSGPTMSEVRTMFMPSEFIRYFKITNGDDQMALQIALEKEGWVFYWQDVTGCFCAEKRMELKDDRLVLDESKPELLYTIMEQSDE